MPRKRIEPMSRHHIWLSDEDYEWLSTTYGRTLGISKAVQLIIRKYRENITATALAKAGARSMEIREDDRLEIPGPRGPEPTS